MAIGAKGEMDATAWKLLGDALLGTITLIALGGAAATVIGAGAAFLVSLCRFPGRGVFEWLLAAPLAAPAYVLAFGYSSLTWAGGPVPLPLTGIAGAAFVYALAFYPYAYLSTRAALATQSAGALEAARMLGAGPRRALIGVALPLARPGIAAGAALIAMEIAADFGAASHFGATTVTTGLFRAWYAHGEPAVALRLASVLLIAAFGLLFVERWMRGRARIAGGTWRAPPKVKLSAPAGLAAAMFCGLIIALAFAAPLGWLARLAATRPASDFDELGRQLLNSFMLAGIGAAATLLVSIAIAAAARASQAGRAALFAASAGYAAPGAAIALGALALFGAAREMGLVGGLSAGLAVFMLVWTYASRFAAAGAQPIEAGLLRITPSHTGAARLLGAGRMRRILAIDLPMAAPSAAAAALIVFVEILKELPATLILRPFDFDTLAVIAYSYASDERLAQSAAPALMVTAAGLVPILLFTRRIDTARPGTRMGGR
ncbi:MAG: iron ABC transporter permease [Hyphomonadaceae bacterium]|nr:iron ABC transporter permease [Hyphomonadaceae bacterium]